jgi:hypothetical protein
VVAVSLGKNAGHHFFITKFALCRYRSQSAIHVVSLIPNRDILRPKVTILSP